MAKDRELQDHERAHSGKEGAEVDHGADWADKELSRVRSENPQGNWSRKDILVANPTKHAQDVKKRFPEYGYRRVSAAANAEGGAVSHRNARYSLKIGRKDKDD